MLLPINNYGVGKRKKRKQKKAKRKNFQGASTPFKYSGKQVRGQPPLLVSKNKTGVKIHPREEV
jgi:hypothetical protein